jgi:dTDP-4-dehydrorhamnose reductase
MQLRVIVLGASGMLGHKLLQRLRVSFDAAGTIRDAKPDSVLKVALGGTKLYADVDARRLASVADAIADWHPSVVVNCIGIIKQIEVANDPVESIATNALFPHQLAQLTTARNAKLIHFSTDCVFSGTRGDYTEDDCPDPTDLYGRTKLLGEVTGHGALTLRTSIVGHELRGHHGLIDWFLNQRGGHAKGFAHARYGGLTTLALVELVADVIRTQPSMDGLWHVSSEAISKFDLLQVVNRVYGLGVQLARDETFVCDRSLNSARFRARTGWRPPSWEGMIAAMHAEASNYACR